MSPCRSADRFGPRHGKDSCETARKLSPDWQVRANSGEGHGLRAGHDLLDHLGRAHDGDSLGQVLLADVTGLRAGAGRWDWERKRWDIGMPTTLIRARIM